MPSYGSVDRLGKVLSNKDEDDNVKDGHRPPAQSPDELHLIRTKNSDESDKHQDSGNREHHYNLFHYLIHAAINVIIAVPGE